MLYFSPSCLRLITTQQAKWWNVSVSRYKGHELSSKFLNNCTACSSNVFELLLLSLSNSQSSFNKYSWPLYQNHIQIIIHHSIYSIISLFELRNLVIQPRCYCLPACVRACYVWQIDWTKIKDRNKDSQHERSELYI